MTQPETFDSITSRNGQLYATRKGKDYALYIFTPLKNGKAVPIGSTWPDYSEPFVIQFAPMPTLTSVPVVQDVQFGTQTRTQDRLYPYTQITANGWPLYYVETLSPGQVNKSGYPAMFAPATSGMTPPPQPTPSELDSGDGDGDPTTFLGP